MSSTLFRASNAATVFLQSFWILRRSFENASYNLHMWSTNPWSQLLCWKPIYSLLQTSSCTYITMNNDTNYAVLLYTSKGFLLECLWQNPHDIMPGDIYSFSAVTRIRLVYFHDSAKKGNDISEQFQYIASKILQDEYWKPYMQINETKNHISYMSIDNTKRSILSVCLCCINKSSRWYSYMLKYKY